MTLTNYLTHICLPALSLHPFLELAEGEHRHASRDSESQLPHPCPSSAVNYSSLAAVNLGPRTHSADSKCSKSSCKEKKELEL